MASAFEEMNARMAKLAIQAAPRLSTKEEWINAKAYLDAVEPILDVQRGDLVFTLGAIEDPEVFLTSEELEAVWDGLSEEAASRGITLTRICASAGEDGEEDGAAEGGSAAPKLYECLLRRIVSKDDFVEVRVATTGNVDSGKSTTLGVLTHGQLDNGRGEARKYILKHDHEHAEGRTSSVTHNILGFNNHGAIVNAVDGHSNELDWVETATRANKLVTFVDLAGHGKYLKTTAFGITGHRPDCAMLMVSASDGLIGTAKQHVKLTVGSDLPMMVLITKVDVAPEHMKKLTRKILKGTLTRMGKIYMEIKTLQDVVLCSHHFATGRVVPVFEVSNVKGTNIDLVKAFLNLLIPLQVNRDKDPVRFQVDDTFTVKGVGTVVSGSVISGVIKPNDVLMLGPTRLNEFDPVQVRSIERHCLPVGEVRSNEMATLALKKVEKKDVRKGMVLVAKELAPRGAWQFEAQLIILHHPTTIRERYQCMVHCGCVRQTAKIMSITDIRVPEGMTLPTDDDGNPIRALRSGCSATVRFSFVRAPEYLDEGTRLIIREGDARGVGCVLTVLHDAPAFNKKKVHKKKRDGLSRRARRRAKLEREAAQVVEAAAAAPPPTE